MTKRSRMLAVGAVALAALAAGAYYAAEGQGRLCEYFGGRWAGEAGVCYTRDCYARGDCGYWSNPAARCAQLKPGDAVAEVVFQLGNPDTVRETRAHWGGRKGYGIEAVIENGRLKALDCRVGTPGP